MSSDVPNVHALTTALRQIQVEFGLAAVSGTIDLGGDSLKIGIVGLREPVIGYIENRAGDVLPFRPERLR